jgi:hypothetical protein
MLDIHDVKDLLTQTDERTLTLFLNVDNAEQENQASRPAWQIWLRETLDEYPRQQNIPEDVWAGIRMRVDRFFEDYQASSRSLVIFAGPGYERKFELPMKVENQVFFGQPQIGLLLWMIDEYEPYLVVMADQEKVRYFVSYLGSVGFQEGQEIDTDEYDFVEKTIMNAPGPGLDNAAVHGGTGVDDFQDTLNEHRARFYRDIVERTGKLLEKHNAERVILAGGERAMHQIQNLMPDRMKAQVVGLVPIPMFATVAELTDKIQGAALEFERKQEFELVDQVVNFAKARGRGALGRKDVEDALAMQRVEMLVLVWPFENEEKDNDLAFRALQLNSGIELVHGEAGALLHQEGSGVGARLYYAL